jgi:Fe2+ or Zn2+ uptake regulation protein
MCEHYRGCFIYKNESEKFSTPYYTIYSPHHHSHVHIGSEVLAQKIVDCYIRLYKNLPVAKYKRNIRNCALRLSGIKTISI